jgi:hypothetical protein
MAELTVGIESGELAPGKGVEGRWAVEWLIFLVGFTTACIATASAIYKAPTGIFNDRKCAYYVSLGSAGGVGLAEVSAAVVWMSRSAGREHAHGSLGRRCVLCASFLPLAFVAGIGGVRMLLK